MKATTSELLQTFVGECRQVAAETKAVLDNLAAASGGAQHLELADLVPLCRLSHTLRNAGLFLNFPRLAAVARVLGELLKTHEKTPAVAAITAPQAQALVRGFKLASQLVEGIASQQREPAMEAELACFAGVARSLDCTWELSGGESAKNVLAVGSASVPLSDSEKVAQLLADEPMPQAGAPATTTTSAPVAAAPDMVSIFVQDAEELLDQAEQDLLHLESEPERQHNLLRHLHTLKGNSGLMGYSELQRLSHRVEHTLQQARDQQTAVPAPTIRLLLEVLDVLRRSVAGVSMGSAGQVPDCEQWLTRLENIGATKPESTPVLELGPTAMKQEPVAAGSVSSAGRGGVRVSVERLDHLNDLTSELVIATAVVMHLSECRQHADAERFNRAFHQLNLLTSELQDLAMAARMVPIEAAFRRLHRLVRDLSEKTGKPVELQLAGAETEVDRRVTELITDPLVHILRNSLDHGIESQEERRRRGKPDVGTIRIEALHRSGEVWIVVSDDGRGVQRQKILAQAQKRGLLPMGVVPRDEDLLSLMFEPGFSTADTITEVSGRGVGLDVVKQNIERVRGRVEVQSTEGLGTTMTIKIPLTLAVIQGMMVRVGAEQFVLPMPVIRELLRPVEGGVHTVLGKGEVVNLRGETIPLFRLAELFILSGGVGAPTAGIVIVVEDGERRLALLVDEVLGQQRVVVKGLGEGLGRIPGVSGASILADGRARLILDVPGLIRLAHERVR